MGKTIRAVVRYRFRQEGNPAKAVSQITTLVDVKDLAVLSAKIAGLRKTHKDIEIISVKWKNWWGLR